MSSWSPDTPDEEVATKGRKKGRGGADPAPATFATIFDIKFGKSLPGILLAIQVVSCFLGLVLGSSWRGSYSGGHVFFVLVVAVAFFCCLGLYLSRMIRLDDLMLRNVDWNIVFACYSGPAALLMLIASCVMVEAAHAVSALKAAGVFGLFAWNALLVSFLLHGRPLWTAWREKVGLPSATATVTAGPHRPAGDAGDDLSSDEWSDDEAEAQDPSEGTGITLTQATLRPPSTVGAPGSQSSLYPVDISGSNRTSKQGPDASHSTVGGGWGPS